MIRFNINQTTMHISLEGSFTKGVKKTDIHDLYSLIDHKNINKFIINLDAILRFDISFIFLLLNYASKIKHLNKECIFEGNSNTSSKILKMLSDIEVTNSEIVRKQKEALWRVALKIIKKDLKHKYNIFLDYMNFIGSLIYYLLGLIVNPKLIRFKAINYHIYSGVITAMPIIFSVSFIVGGVISYQGAATLDRMGFIQAAVAMTAKLTLREIGPFVVALIVAGRSASAYTAQIGVMKITEELNAMKTMNFNVFNFIIIPRFIALVFSFPLMVFLSDLVSVFGCMFFLKFGFNISFYDYIVQLKEGVGMNSFWIGIIKAPFYAAIIVIIGCFTGFKIEDNTQSIGEKTTQSVVYALFGVIIVNALFSLIFTELGW